MSENSHYHVNFYEDDDELMSAYVDAPPMLKVGDVVHLRIYKDSGVFPELNGVYQIESIEYDFQQFQYGTTIYVEITVRKRRE